MLVQQEPRSVAGARLVEIVSSMMRPIKLTDECGLNLTNEGQRPKDAGPRMDFVYRSLKIVVAIDPVKSGLTSGSSA